MCEEASPNFSSPHVPLNIGLALSGGGLRAAIFHLGMLRFLSEHGLLGNVCYLSTVSGGSLITGLLLKANNYKWPVASIEFDAAYQIVKDTLLSKNIQLSYIAKLLNPWNWRHWFSRANLVAQVIERKWHIGAALCELPDYPVWAINGTSMESGRRWRFRVDVDKRTNARGTSMGDGATGYWDAAKFPLAKAMAASAAFPGGVTPLVIKVENELPHRPYSPGGADSATSKYLRIHIADGGIYDNLGLEPLFDASSRSIRSESSANFLLVSDAGAPLTSNRWGLWAQGLGFSSRTINIMHVQGRNMRTRNFVGAIIQRSCKGVFLNIAESREEVVARFKGPFGDKPVPLQLSAPALNKGEVKIVSGYPTTLWKPNGASFANIERHGYEAAMTHWFLYGQQQLSECPLMSLTPPLQRNL